VSNDQSDLSGLPIFAPQTVAVDQDQRARGNGGPIASLPTKVAPAEQRPVSLSASELVGENIDWGLVRSFRGGWGLAPAGQSLLLIVGGIAVKPAVVEDRIEPRDILDLTIAFDHDVIDGAPAARFARRLVDLIESGAGLRDLADA
jgi:pyruvate/2-oxoglutarate dehydrogenase complex dihydrolipoamide acyltransferase (E2) component